MEQQFRPGDFLIFQLESGYALLRVLEVDNAEGVWHLAAYQDLFLDPESVDSALERPEELTIDKPHIALTNRAFESTQVSRMSTVPLTAEEKERVDQWKRDPQNEASDRSVRLMLGLR